VRYFYCRECTRIEVVQDAVPSMVHEHLLPDLEKGCTVRTSVPLRRITTADVNVLQARQLQELAR
jgi:hypothetical protein